MKNLADMLAIYGTYKTTSRGNNAAGTKLVLWLIGIVTVGYLILKGIVKLTGFDSLYAMVGHVLLVGFKLFLVLMAIAVVIGIISWILFSISSFLIGIANRD